MDSMKEKTKLSDRKKRWLRKMSSVITKDYVNDLVFRVKHGDEEAFGALVEIASPLLCAMASKFSKYHRRFEYDDFYSISQAALYGACIEFEYGNPSFLSYARVFILNRCNREIEYWNQKKRNIFDISEVGLEVLTEEPVRDEIQNQEFTSQLSEIIRSNFQGEQLEIVSSYYIEDRRICDIAEEMGLKYKKAYSTIQRATKKIVKIYKETYLDEGN